MKKPTKKKITPVSVRELKTWLDGYCSAHGDKWSPSPEQWEMIKNKIFALDDEAQASYSAPAQKAVFPQQIANQTRQHTNVVSVPPMNPMNSMVQPIDPMSHGNESTVISLSPQPAFIDQNGKMKTPDKVTPGGPSDFA